MDDTRTWEQLARQLALASVVVERRDGRRGVRCGVCGRYVARLPVAEPARHFPRCLVAVIEARPAG